MNLRYIRNIPNQTTKRSKNGFGLSSIFYPLKVHPTIVSSFNMVAKQSNIHSTVRHLFVKVRYRSYEQSINNTKYCSSRIVCFFLLDGYALQNHAIAKLEVFSELQCAMACTAKQNCSSINVKKKANESFLCDLNDSNKLKSPADYVPKAGYMYFDTNGEQQVRNTRGYLNCMQSLISPCCHAV